MTYCALQIQPMLCILYLHMQEEHLAQMYPDRTVHSNVLPPPGPSMLSNPASSQLLDNVHSEPNRSLYSG